MVANTRDCKKVGNQIKGQNGIFYRGTGGSESEKFFTDKLWGERKIISLENKKIILEYEPKVKYPVIRPDKNVVLYVNGEKKDGLVIVSGEEEITVETLDEKPVANAEIRVTEDGLKAYLKFTQRHGKKFSPIIMKDPRAEADYIITTEEEIISCEEKIGPETVNKAIADSKIKYGIMVNEEKIAAAINNPGKEILIAKGRPPVDCVDEEIVYLFKKEEATDGENSAWIADKDDKIDYFGFIKIFSVRPGEILAMKKECKCGKPGMDVYGKKIEVLKPNVIEWNLGEGVVLINNKAVATRMGRPVINNGQLAVLNVYYMHKNVDISVGSIDYDGDVVISGNVCDNFSVKASGLIRIGKDVSRAKITAGENILINGNIIASFVNAGGFSDRYSSIETVVKRLYMIFKIIEKMILQLEHKESPVLPNQGEIILNLLLTKYKDVKKAIGKLLEQEELLAGILEPSELISFIEQLGFFLAQKTAEINLDLLTEVNRKFSRLNRFFEGLTSKEASIYAGYVQNSTLRATGDIVVSREGVYNSILRAWGKVSIEGIPGVFRGGEIKAPKGVYARELGSAGGSKVIVEVGASGRIKAEIAYDNVYLKIANRMHRLEKETRNINAHLDKEGHLLLR